ncbi:MAG: FHA domain-containing protein [Anaerolineales bacterium]
MKRRHIWFALMLLVGLLLTRPLTLAQGSGPVVDILGKPNSRTAPPNAHAYVSVVDRSTGRIVEGLTGENVSVEVSEEPVVASASPDVQGLAVVLVVDRGGIARQGDPRSGAAVDLAGNLLSMLNLDGSPTADMVALIGIRGAEAGGLTPLVPFTSHDPVVISNEFDALRTEVVPEVTPLYDGIDKAIEWLTENPDPQLQDELAHRRRVIIVFSDGIDRQFSSEAHETFIVDQCQEQDILLYAIRMGGGATDADNLQALATQTNGLYVSHTPESTEAVLGLFQNVVTQRQVYRVTFPLLRPQGDYEVRIRMLNTPLGAGADTAMVSSRLQPLRLTLVAPPDTEVTVPYSDALDSFEQTVIPLGVQVNVGDNVPREPGEVIYFANGLRIGASTTPPDFQFDWEVSALITPTTNAAAHDYTILAGSADPYLGTEMMTRPYNVEVVWEAEELTAVEAAGQLWYENWWVLLIFALLTIGLLALLFLLIKTRGQLAAQAVSATGNAIRSATRRLTPGTVAPARAKLVIVQGPGTGREFRIAAPEVKVGRDPQVNDFELQDQFISNPHFTISAEQGRFFIQDEKSTNGTQLNGEPLPPGQRVPLPPDSIIEAGQSRLQLRRLGGETRRMT